LFLYIVKVRIDKLIPEKHDCVVSMVDIALLATHSLTLVASKDYLAVAVLFAVRLALVICLIWILILLVRVGVVVMRSRTELPLNNFINFSHYL
jgi:energy-converting hydrogenase Eha subunit C